VPAPDDDRLQEQLGSTQMIQTVVSTAESASDRRMFWLRLALYPSLVGLLLLGYWILLLRGVAAGGVAVELVVVGLAMLPVAYLLELGFHLAARRRRSTRSLKLLLVTCFVLVGTYALQLNGSLSSYMVLFYALVIFFTRLRLDFRAALYATALAVLCFVTVVALEHVGLVPYARMLRPLYAPGVTHEPAFAAVIVTGAVAFLLLAFLGAQVLVRSLESREEALSRATRQLHVKNEELQAALEQLRQAQQELILKEKMATLGGLVSGVVHEINSPIGALNAAADTATRAVQQLQKTIEAAESLEALRGSRKLTGALKALEQNSQVGRDAGARVAAVAERLRSFARLDEAELQQVDLHAELDAAVAMLGEVIGDRIEVVRRYGDLPRTGCYPGMLNQAFVKLLDNAARSIEGQGTITIETGGEGDGRAVVSISDTGRGIPPELLDGIFELGFNPKGSGPRGRMGLSVGLAMVQEIVRKHRGSVSVESTVGRGTTFRVEIGDVLKK
jgi:signal transduction histidine kinase